MIDIWRPGGFPDLQSGVLTFFRDIDIKNGQIREAIARYEFAYPELISSEGPAINTDNYIAAIELADLYRRVGDEEQVRQLLDSVTPIIDSQPIVGMSGSGPYKAQVALMQGGTESGLDVLQEVVDAGWRASWRYVFDIDPAFEALRDEPRFKLIRTAVDADMGGQLARVRELEASGDIIRPEDLPQ